jgi:4-alpha-glucanotransferase
MGEPEDSILATPAAAQWQNIGIANHHGVDIPLFSLHSKESCGIGEFTDLLPLIPWAKELGLSVLQLLPLNDTGPENSPFLTLSAYALNPMHLGLEHLPRVKEYSALTTMLRELKPFNQSQFVNYRALYTARRSFLHEYFNRFHESIQNTSEFQTFRKDNPWLQGYALFKALKEFSAWSNWESWPEEVKNPTAGSLLKLMNRFESDILFHEIVQYLCFQQMQKVKSTAQKHDILIMGDLPILINRESADVWLERPLFVLKESAGAPPDMYAAEGQNWGFPLYNWESMEKTNYAWWRTRLKIASNFYHIYRLDHIVGFFRIWGIPAGRKATEGYFVPEDPSTWIAHGEKILRIMLEEKSMLPIGEDLGVIPPDVRTCMKKLGICGTKVMRWERMWDEDRRFIEPQNYPYISLTTVSTHDSETLQQWWSNSRQEAEEYARHKGWIYNPTLAHEQLFEILHDSHHTKSLFHINLLQEYLALLPSMTWGSPRTERINLPGIVSDQNWSYRFRPTVEELVQNKDLKAIVQKMLQP